MPFCQHVKQVTGDEKLSDEVVHLAAGISAAGYRGVVATMWSISDVYGLQRISMPALQRMEQNEAL